MLPTSIRVRPPSDDAFPHLDLPVKSSAMARPAHDYARVDRHVPVTRRAETANPYSPVMILISVIATLGILLYAQFLLDPNNRGDLLPYALVIAAEGVLVVHALLAMWTMLSGAKSPRDFAFHAAKRALLDHEAGPPERPELLPVRLDGREISVDVLSPSTARTWPRSGAPRPRRWRSRASTAPGSWTTGAPTRCGRLADELGCRYLRRLSSTGAKAGNVNHALSLAQGRLLLHLRRRLRAASGVHRAHAALLHRRDRRLRADPADLRQPAST